MSERFKRTKWYMLEIWSGSVWEPQLLGDIFVHLKDARRARDQYKMMGTLARVVQYQKRVLP